MGSDAPTWMYPFSAAKKLASNSSMRCTTAFLMAWRKSKAETFEFTHMCVTVQTKR